MVTLIEALFVLFVVLQAGDVWTTHKVLAQGGREQNPVANRVMEVAGFIPATLIFKSAAIAAAYALREMGMVDILAGLCALYAWIVVKNYRHIR